MLLNIKNMNNKDYLRCILLKNNLDIKNHKLEIKVHFNFNNWLAVYVDGTIPIMYDLSTYVTAVQYTSILTFHKVYQRNGLDFL
jgi:hypothetical protein